MSSSVWPHRHLEPNRVVELPGAKWERREYALGLLFTELTPAAERAVAELCGDAFTRQE